MKEFLGLSLLLRLTVKAFPKICIGVFSVVIAVFPETGREIFAQGTFPTIAGSRSTVQDILSSPGSKPKADTYFLLGMAAARKGNVNEAMKAVETGLAIDPGNIKLLDLRAALWARQGLSDKARAEFARILTLDPEDHYARESLRSLERILIPRVAPATPMKREVEPRQQPETPVVQSSKPDTASEPAKVLHSEYFEQMQEKQRCYQRLMCIKKAQEAYLKDNSTSSGSFDLNVLLQKGYIPSTPVCGEKGRYTWESDAPVCSVHGRLKDIEAEVNTVFADFNKGMIAKLSRNFAEALRSFDQVVILFPRWAEAHFQLADTLFRMGEDQASISRLRECLKLAPENLDAKMLIANLYFKTGQIDSAIAILDEVAEKASGSVYGFSAKSLASVIRSGKSYYQVFPPQ